MSYLEKEILRIKSDITNLLDFVTGCLEILSNEEVDVGRWEFFDNKLRSLKVSGILKSLCTLKDNIISQIQIFCMKNYTKQELIDEFKKYQKELIRILDYFK